MSSVVPGRYRVITEQGADLARVIARQPERSLIFCDFDGTLAPIVARPEQARLLPAARQALRRLLRRLGVVLVTGRPVATVLALGDLERLGGVERLRIRGQYGAERWEGTDRRLISPAAPAGLEAARQEIGRLIEVLGADHDLAGVAVEDKGLALAVHTRQATDPVAALRTLGPGLQAIAARGGLQLEPGRQVLELRAATTTKGDAVRQVLAEAGPGGDWLSVVCIGDDRGDIPAFEAVAGWREARPGRSAAVMSVASAEVPVLWPAADLIAEGPPGVADWLGELADLLEGPPAGAEELSVGSAQRPVDPQGMGGLDQTQV